MYARLINPEYEQWQNELFVSKLELLGKSISKLTTMYDPVLKREPVNTGMNPGRMVARNG